MSNLPRCTLVTNETGDMGTFGFMYFMGQRLFTGELPDRNNLPNVSRISSGIFKVVWSYSPHFGRFMYLILGTDPRTGIRAHPANLMGDVLKKYLSQLNGCIALGEKLGWMDGQKAVLVSRPAVRRFEEALGHRPFELEIIR